MATCICLHAIKPVLSRFWPILQSVNSCWLHCAHWTCDNNKCTNETNHPALKWWFLLHYEIAGREMKCCKVSATTTTVVHIVTSINVYPLYQPCLIFLVHPLSLPSLMLLICLGRWWWCHAGGSVPDCHHLPEWPGHLAMQNRGRLWLFSFWLVKPKE